MEIQKQLNSYTFTLDDIYIGQCLDVLDKVNKWLNGQVLGIQNNQIYIHYTGWHPKFDEFVPIDSGRILKQWEHGKPIKLNNRIDVYHQIAGWLQARVIELGQRDMNEEINKVKVHFFNYHRKYDMWVNIKDKNQVTLIGQKSKGYGVGKRKRSQTHKKYLSELARQILRQKLIKMLRQLNQRDYIMKQIGGDGNCLFRSISDQLYGTQIFHKQIREICMKYILQEKVFFQNFIVEDVEQYVQRKSKDGVWGDDIEIEALSQIYARPIQIYAMSIKPIRTFHQDNEFNIEPLKIAYIGSCHYNSIKKKGQQSNGLINTTFGEFQTIFFNTYLEHKNSQIYWINRNRNKFSHYNPLQLTVQQRIEAETLEKNEPQQFERDLMQQAIEISENEQISKQIQAAQLKELQKKLEQQAIQKELRRLQEEEMQQAKKKSIINQSSEISRKQKPYWFEGLQMMGFSSEQIWFAIQIKGYDPQSVQNFLLDNM